MKKAGRITVCMLALLQLFGCKAKEQPAEPAKTQTTEAVGTVTFVNDVTDADVWILPRTEDNLKTSLWGTATASAVKTGESRVAPLCKPGDDGLYMLRMIDADHFYYSADSIVLQAGWTLRITEDELHTATVTVTDENGEVRHTYDVFSARL